MLDSIALIIGQAVMTTLIATSIVVIVFVAYVAIYKLNEYIKRRRGIIARRINRRYRLLLKVRDGLEDIDTELNGLIRDSIELDTMIYAYIYDKEAYEKIKADKRLRATIIEIPTEEVQ